VKAFLLAAGLGTRLAPLTDSTPKCMLPIDGRPLLEIWLKALEEAGADEVLVNLHYLPDVVQGYLERRNGSLATRTSFEPELLGSAGTLAANRAWVEGDDMFLACYADGLTDFDLSALVRAHQEGGTDATVTVFHADQPSACGIVELGPGSLVTGFVEKPEHPVSDLANAGMYAFSPRVLDLVSAPWPKDIGYDLLPSLVGRARAVEVGDYRDIGTVSAYHRACQDWAARASR